MTAPRGRRLTNIERNMLDRFPFKGRAVPFPELDDSAHHAAETVFMQAMGLPQLAQELLVERIGDLVVSAVDEAAAIVGQPQAPWINDAKRQSLKAYFGRLRTLHTSSLIGGRA